MRKRGAGGVAFFQSNTERMSSVTAPLPSSEDASMAANSCGVSTWRCFLKYREMVPAR